VRFLSLRVVPTLVKLLIPLALAAAVLVAAMTVDAPRTHARPSPTRSLQINR
jgi:hypothetical protein